MAGLLKKKLFAASLITGSLIYLIDCVLGLDLDIHGDEEGEKEEHTAGQGHQLTARPNINHVNPKECKFNV